MTDQPTLAHPTVADGELAELTLEEMGPQGDTLARLDGEVVNVFGGIQGEVVTARVYRYRRKRKRYVSAIVTEVLEPSPHRVAAPCPYFGPCTGCQWQHIDYGHQLTLKREAVEVQLRRYDELKEIPVCDTIPSPQTFGYRNHARFAVRQQGSLVFTNRITRSFVKIDECMLMDPWINGTLRALQGRCRETTGLSIRYGVNTSEWLVQPALTNPDVPLATGQAHYRERILGSPFRIASSSFFQVNTKQTERLALLVRDRLQLTGDETLVDAYAGVGTFSVLLAPFVRKVIAIEESESAVKDAAINTLGLENLEFIQGRTEDVLATLGSAPDAVVLDPSRVGCGPAALEAVVQMAPKRLVYVSCDPETLARDLQVLVNGGLSAQSVEPIDMFPQTHHVECVATLGPGGR